jgi:hypothetical protein
MVNESCVGEALSQLEARAFHKMKMKPTVVAIAIMRANGKWAVVEKFRVCRIVERPAETAPGARGSN